MKRLLPFLLVVAASAQINFVGAGPCTITNSQTTGYVLTATNNSTGCAWQAAGAATVDNNAVANATGITDTSVTANTITGTTTTTFPASYAAFQHVIVKVANTNTGAVTININSIGPKNVTTQAGAPLASGTLQAGGIYALAYDGTEFQLIATATGGGTPGTPSGSIQKNNGGAFGASNLTENADGSDNASKALTWASKYQPTYNSGGTTTCDFSQSNLCEVHPATGATTLAFTNPHGSGPYMLRTVQGASPVTNPYTFPGTVSGGAQPDNSANAVTEEYFTYDGANYQGQGGACPTCNYATLQTTTTPATPPVSSIRSYADSTANSNCSVDSSGAQHCEIKTGVDVGANGTVFKVNGVSYPANPSTNQVPVVTSANIVTTTTYETVPDCTGVSNALSFSQSTHIFGCNTIAGSGGSGFTAPPVGVMPPLGFLPFVPIGTQECASSASPAVCQNYLAGTVLIPTGTNPTLVVNTSGVTTLSRIVLTVDASASLGVTCNSTLATITSMPAISARTAGTSFTIAFNGTVSTNGVCVNYHILN